jgi:Ca-activated chloride channel family protein
VEYKHKIVQIGLQGKQISTENLPPSNLVFLIDVSGSMNDPNKLPLVQASLKLLTTQLREEDRVAIVTYAGNAGLVLPSTTGSAKNKIENAIDNLQAGGSTAGGEGIKLAYKIAEVNKKQGRQ